MRKIVPTLAATAALALGATATLAQSTPHLGPDPQHQAAAQGVYTGPTSVPLTTVRQLLDTGRDDQISRLQGRIISFEGDERYLFEDDTGRITVEIDDDDFPRGQAISAEQLVELLGELDKDRRHIEFEVDRVTLLP